MAKQPLKADEILIGRVGNLISKHPDGDMVFKDAFVPEVKLKDLLGGSIVVDPAILVEILSADWNETVVDDQIRFSLSIPHTYDINSSPKLQINVFSEDNEMITLNRVIINSNNIFLESTIRINAKIVIKKL